MAIDLTHVPTGEKLCESCEPFSVAILAGGLSTRMGTDKSRLRLTAEGPMLIELVVERTTSLSNDQFVVNRHGQSLPEISLRTVADAYGDTGVLGGIATALREARFGNVLVVSCDMPFLDSPLLQAIGCFASAADVVVPALDQPSRQTPGGTITYQTLHARYSKTCLPAIESALKRNERRVISFFSDVEIETIPETFSRRFSPDLRSFTSVNDPSDLDDARVLYKATKSE